MVTEDQQEKPTNTSGWKVIVKVTNCDIYVPNPGVRSLGICIDKIKCDTSYKYSNAFYLFESVKMKMNALLHLIHCKSSKLIDVYFSSKHTQRWHF